MSMKKSLTASQQKELLLILNKRFEDNMKRHKTVLWANAEKKLKAHPDKLVSLFRMEETGGEPDITGYDAKNGEYIFMDCSAESPMRRSLCYDQEALDSRKENKPSGSAVGMAEEMGIELLTEADYHDLQKLGSFDTKTSSWLKTPEDVRKLGGAIFGDRRYNRVFIYHNGVQSYYAARGFRGKLIV